MTKLYAHPESSGYVGGLCAPRDFKTRSELTSREGLYAIPRAKTRKGELVCDYCGMKLWETNGMFRVFKWRRDGRYRDEDAVATYSRRDTADLHADRLGLDYVVRAW